MPTKTAWVTLLTKTSYLPGCLVLERNLRDVGSKYPLVIMVTPSLPTEAREALLRQKIKLVDIDPLVPEKGSHVLDEADARFADTWTKLRGFDLVDYKRIVLLDSDMLIRRNMDELMDLDLPSDWIAAAHVCACNPHKLPHYPADWIPMNCAHTAVKKPTDPPVSITPTSPRPYTLLNSGLVVLHPSADMSPKISHFLATSPLVKTFSFPDQDFLAHFFKGRWKPLNWYYNALKTLRNVHSPLWSDDEVRCVHYILAQKPWHVRVGEPGTGGPYEDVNRWWWNTLDNLVDDLTKTDERTKTLVLSNVVKA